MEDDNRTKPYETTEWRVPEKRGLEDQPEPLPRPASQAPMPTPPRDEKK